MPSIFIWKASTPCNSKKTIRVYSGSNWALEDNESVSKSYIYLEQIVISESDNSVITFQTKDMPQDWIGSDLLEVSSVPYELIKTDTYGTLERVGEWLRFTTKANIQYNEKSLKNEYNIIKKWIDSKKSTNNYDKNNYNHHNNNKNNQKQYNMHIPKAINNASFDINKIQVDFQQFLIKYNMPIGNNNVNNINKYNNTKPIYKKST